MLCPIARADSRAAAGDSGHLPFQRRGHLECLGADLARRRRSAGGCNRRDYRACRFAQYRRVEVAEALPEFVFDEPVLIADRGRRDHCQRSRRAASAAAPASTLQPVSETRSSPRFETGRYLPGLDGRQCTDLGSRCGLAAGRQRRRSSTKTCIRICSAASARLRHSRTSAACRSAIAGRKSTVPHCCATSCPTASTMIFTRPASSECSLTSCRAARPKKLSIHARYQRRGGIDINPFRSNADERPENSAPLASVARSESVGANILRCQLVPPILLRRSGSDDCCRRHRSRVSRA